MKITIDGNHRPTDVATPSDLVAELYKDELKRVADALASEAKKSNLVNVKIALSDKTLLEQLAEILDEYAVIGVCADLQSEPVGKTSRDQENLFPKDGNHKSLSHCQAFLYYASTPSFPVDLDKKFLNYESPSGKNKRSAKDAYNNYFKWFIVQDVIQDRGQKSGIVAFYERYPSIEHAVKTSVENFKNNIISACNNIHNDWDRIFDLFMKDNDFTDSKLMKLVKITSTGNDFHKGGKQVLILTFSNGASTPVTKKLVYKPADIEIDYRLVGDTSNMPADLLPDSLKDQKSLIEIINDPLYILPTYRILPRNPGSELHEAGGKIPIQDSYGYIEFLTHEPQTKKPTVSNSPNWVAVMDVDVRQFFWQWGGLLAVASVFSLSDLHRGNVIVHQCQPHLIDLEIAFTGPMDGIAGTLAEDGLKEDKETTEGGKRKRENKGTPELEIRLEPAPITKYTYNRIWRLDADSKSVKLVEPEDYISVICQGMREVFQIIKDKSKSGDIDKWMNATQLQKVITRFTPYATKEFYTYLRQYYSYFTCIQEPEVPDENTFVQNRGTFAHWFKMAVQNWDNKIGKNWPDPRPNYAIQTFPHNFTDYLNCDVPSYYHRLEERDLLNARGEKVKIKRSDLTIPGGVIIGRSPGRSTYFPESTWGIVVQQLNDMKTEPNKRLNQCLDDLQSWFSKDTSAFKDFIKV